MSPEKFFCLSLRGYLGSCAAGATCSFSGMLIVDVTSGMVTALHITFPGLSAFNVLEGQVARPSEGAWQFDAGNNSSEELRLALATTPTPASLVGFAGGRILDGSFVFNVVSGETIYRVRVGDIAPLPEPDTFGLLGTGVIGLAGMARRKRKLGT